MGVATFLLILLAVIVAASVGFVLGNRLKHQPVSIAVSHQLTSQQIPTSLADLGLHLAGLTDRMVLLRRAGEWLHKEYGFPLIVIYPYSLDAHELISPIVVGREIPGLAERLRLGVGVYGDVARNMQSHFVDSINLEPRFGPTAADMQVAYIVPLVHGLTLLGVLGVHSNRPNSLHEPERALLDRAAILISALTSVTIQLANSQQAIKRFDRFQVLTRRLTDRLDSEQLLQEVVETAREMLDTQMSVLLDLQQDSEDFHPIAWSGISDENAALLRSRYKEDLKGMVAWARLPARTPDLHTDQRTALATQASAAGMLSELAAPVVYGDKLFGVLAVETDVHRHFTDEETNLLSALASHAGIALRNAQLFERLQDTNRQFEQTNADLMISQQQTENARLSAVEANRLKTEFVNNMSHELRTPLNAVINFTRIVMDGHAGPVTPDQVQYLSFVHDSGQHLLGLINDILDMAKIEAGKMELRREPTDLEPIFRGVMSTAIGLTRNKGLWLKQECPADLPYLNIDGMRIRQVLLNLLSNASKFTPQGGITLRAEKRIGQVVISVQDTGIGIKAEDLPKVFEEFRQIDGSLQRTETGTGLGMPISRRFVQIHGGDMWIESQIGVGTTVYFSLPMTGTTSEPLTKAINDTANATAR